MMFVYVSIATANLQLLHSTEHVLLRISLLSGKAFQSNSASTEAVMMIVHTVSLSSFQVTNVQPSQNECFKHKI